MSSRKNNHQINAPIAANQKLMQCGQDKSWANRGERALRFWRKGAVNWAWRIRREKAATRIMVIKTSLIGKFKRALS